MAYTPIPAASGGTGGGSDYVSTLITRGLSKCGLTTATAKIMYKDFVDTAGWSINSGTGANTPTSVGTVVGSFVRTPAAAADILIMGPGVGASSMKPVTVDETGPWYVGFGGRYAVQGTIASSFFSMGLMDTTNSHGIRLGHFGASAVTPGSNSFFTCFHFDGANQEGAQSTRPLDTNQHLFELWTAAGVGHANFSVDQETDVSVPAVHPLNDKCAFLQSWSPAGAAQFDYFFAVLITPSGFSAIV